MWPFSDDDSDNPACGGGHVWGEWKPSYVMGNAEFEFVITMNSRELRLTTPHTRYCQLSDCNARERDRRVADYIDLPSGTMPSDVMRVVQENIEEMEGDE